MKCPKCQHKNPESTKFCGECGTQLIPQPDAQLLVTETLETSQEELATGSIFAGRYQVIEELGKGGMGMVYKALDQKTNEKVALKLIKPEIASNESTVKRFRNELTTARRISHRNVCRMHDLGESAGTHYITMEYVSGEDLKSLLSRIGRMPLGKALDIGSQVCRGLIEAHSLGIIHRDLKPGNIMIDKDGNAKIMDFGIARSEEGGKVTGTGVIIGTPEYMSPEQAEAEDVDLRSDVYSLGIILYEMVTGRVPFTGKSGLSVAMKQKGERPVDPREINPSVPIELSELILKCLEKEREKRFDSADAVRAALDELARLLPSKQSQISRRKSRTSKELTVTLHPGRLLIPTLIVGTLVIAAAVLIWKPWSSGPSAPAPKIENSVAVISFENQTGDDGYDHLQKVIPSLLRTNLEDTDLFYVVTRERMRDLCRQLGREDTEFIDSDLGFEICRREGVAALVTGFYTKGGDLFTTAATVYDVDTKKSLKSVQSSGIGEQSFFEIQIDDLSRDIAQGLGVTDKGSPTDLFHVADVTTESMEAYKYYLEGCDYRRKLYTPEARISLEKAVQLDPGFAMAYLELAGTYANLGELEFRDRAIKKAMDLSPKTTERERLTIEANYANWIENDLEHVFRILQLRAKKFPKEKNVFIGLGTYYQNQGNIEEAIKQFNKALDLDPDLDRGLISLGYIYIDQRAFSKSLAIFNKYVSLHPDEANPFDSLAETYFWMGRLDEALMNYKKVLEIKPDFPGIQFRIGYIHAVKEEYGEAMNWLEKSMPKLPPSLRPEGHLWKGFLHYWLGNEEEWERNLRTAEETANRSDYEIDMKLIEWIKAFMCYEAGALDQSRKHNENWLRFYTETYPNHIDFYRSTSHYLSGLIDVKAGDMEGVAKELAELKSILEEMTEDRKEWVLHFIKHLSAEAALAAGSPDEAILVFEDPVSYSPGVFTEQNMDTFLIYNLPALKDVVPRAYEQQGNIDGAIAAYERLLAQNTDSLTKQLVHPLYHCRLAVLYERRGRNSEAAIEYQEFLDLWRDADPGLPEVENARKRLAELKGELPDISEKEPETL